MSEGIIYVLINEAMPGYTKIGKTSTSVEQRIRELDSSGVPLPFECFFAGRFADIDFVERRIHDAFADSRTRKRREFFEVDPARIRSALEIGMIEDVTPQADIIESADDQTALDKARVRTGLFNFKMVDIPPGSVLTFVKNEAITCEVVNKSEVTFEDETLSISAAALRVINSLGYNWTKISGPQHWKFGDETLYERRQRMNEGG